MVDFFKAYTDEFGLILTKDKDGGDAAARLGNWGTFSYALYMLGFFTTVEWLEICEMFKKALAHIQIEPGLFIRHPEKSPNWDKEGARDFSIWNDWQVFSRDQWIQLYQGMFCCNCNTREMTRGAFKRYGIMQNGGVLGPSHWGLIVRSDPTSRLFKFRFINDLFLLGGVIIQSFHQDDDNAINGCSMLVFCNFWYPTFMSKAALWVAKTFNDFQNYFDKYFAQIHLPEHKRNPGAPFHQYCTPIFNRLFK